MNKNTLMSIISLRGNDESNWLLKTPRSKGKELPKFHMLGELALSINLGTPPRMGVIE